MERQTVCTDALSRASFGNRRGGRRTGALRPSAVFGRSSSSRQTSVLRDADEGENERTGFCRRSNVQMATKRSVSGGGVRQKQHSPLYIPARVGVMGLASSGPRTLTHTDICVYIHTCTHTHTRPPVTRGKRPCPSDQSEGISHNTRLHDFNSK